eukprot:3360487-Rhodomonas_salina.2
MLESKSALFLSPPSPLLPSLPACPSSPPSLRRTCSPSRHVRMSTVMKNGEESNCWLPYAIWARPT